MVSRTGNDLQNGILGFSPEVQSGLVLDEDSDSREVQLIVTRQPNRCRQRLIKVLSPHAVMCCVEIKDAAVSRRGYHGIL